MGARLKSIGRWLMRWVVGISPAPIAVQWQQHWSDFLDDKVAFYRDLSRDEQALFGQRVLLFLQTTAIESGDLVVTEQDRLLVAASAIIPVWGFPRWHYFNLKVVHLMPASFNRQFQCGRQDSTIVGMVGSGELRGKMVLSWPALHLGFANTTDRRNVGIHEFAHLLDMADGDCDGFPERLSQFAFSIPWFELVQTKIGEIDRGKSNIDDYGATNRAEFFSVATEYFFEQPGLMARKHPRLYATLAEFYQLDTQAIGDEITAMKAAECACNSGKSYGQCCLPAD